MVKSGNSYPFLFEGRYGFMLRPLLNALFSQLNLPEFYRRSLGELQAEGHLVYVHSGQSTLDAMLLNSRLAQCGLPVPRLIFGRRLTFFQPLDRLGAMLGPRTSPFDEGVYENFMADADNASLLFLDMPVSRTGEDPLLALIRLQREQDRPILLVPQRLIYTRTLLKAKDSRADEPGQISGWRKFTTLLRGEEHGFVEHGDPLNLKEFLEHENDTHLLDEVAREVRAELDHRCKLLSSNVSGAPIRERSFIIKKTIKDPILQSFLRDHARETGVVQSELEQLVEKNLEQIAANLSPNTVEFLRKRLEWIFNNIYDGIDVNEDGLQRLKEVASQGSLVYVPCHKSHTDYLLLSYFLYHQWMSIPTVAAGINLSFFPLGPIFRGAGAFFMRRTFKGDPLYSQTFAAYVRTLLGERIPIEFFIEGTRSRSGKLMLPKMGLLSMIIQGWDAGASRDVIFVPVYVGYDQVVEENSYIREMKGAPKQKETFWQLLKARKVLKNRYGKVYIRFADPLSLNEYMKGRPTYHELSEDGRHELYNSIGQEIIDEIYQQTVATPMSVLACVLMSHTSGLETGFARSIFDLHSDYLDALGYNLAASFHDRVLAFDDTLTTLKDKGLVSIDEGENDDQDLIVVDQEKRIHLEYYKNTTLNCFVPVSVISNILLRYPEGIGEKALRAEAVSLAGLLAKEFILDMDSFTRALNYLLDHEIIVLQQGSYHLSPQGHDVALMDAGLIENYLESYLAVLYTIDKAGAGRDVLKTINRHATRLYKKGEIKRLEALCLPNYKGALETFRSRGLIDKKNTVIDRTGVEEMIHEIEAYLED